jgi:hypothetical protein
MSRIEKERGEDRRRYAVDGVVTKSVGGKKNVDTYVIGSEDAGKLFNKKSAMHSIVEYGNRWRGHTMESMSRRYRDTVRSSGPATVRLWHSMAIIVPRGTLILQRP